MTGGIEVTVAATGVVRLATAPPLAAKILPGPVLILIGCAAGLLTGDVVTVDITLEPDAQLTVRTVAATIAHPCRAGGSTRFDIDCRLGAGAALQWLPEPLIACAGCRHHGRARLRLGRNATATWLECLTLGRSGEQPGTLSQRLDVALDGRPLLRDGLQVGPGAEGWDGPAVLGGRRHLGSLHLLGRRAGVAGPGVMQLAGPGTTARFLADRADELAGHVAAALPAFSSLVSPPPIPSDYKETLRV